MAIRIARTLMQHEFAWESICVCVLCLCLSEPLSLHVHMRYELKSKYDRELTTVFTRFFVFLRDFLKKLNNEFTNRSLWNVTICKRFDLAQHINHLHFYVFWRRENAATTWGSILQMQDWLHRPGSCPPLPQPCTECSKQDYSGTQALDLAVTPAENSIF